MMGANVPCRNPAHAPAPLGPCRGRRRVAATLPVVRRDGWRGRRAVRRVLGGDEFLRAAVVRGMWRAVPAPDGRGRGLRRLRAPAAELAAGAGGAALRPAQPPFGIAAEAWRPYPSR